LDNNNPVRGGLVFLPQLLQWAGHKTGPFGKWHMGGYTNIPPNREPVAAPSLSPKRLAHLDLIM
jgi:arylsulfatase A-like enzyme